nr:MAG: class I SAM-dependent methyltransferase [Chloroflexota bacterium]
MTMYARLVRWLFQRLYREFAWSYDLVAAAVSGGRWRSWVLTARRYARGRTLELGCGPGFLQQALAGEPGVAPIGMDHSPQMIALARRNAGASVPPHLLRADARALPLSSATVDTVVATFPSEYIADPQTAAEIRRVLRPGGTVAVALWAELEGDSLYHRAIDLAYRLTLQRSPRVPHPAANDAAGAAPVPASQRRLGELLAGSGFRVAYERAPAPGSQVHYVVGTLQP